MLAIPGLLWLAFALLARQWVLLLLVAASALAGQPSTALQIDERVVPWSILAGQLPVVLLALAGMYRQPGAGAWARMLWKRGKALVALTALLNLVWAGRLLAASDYWAPWPELFLACSSLLDAAITLSVYTTPYHRQLFEEFPRPHPPSSP